MNLRRVGVLLGKELVRGPRSCVFLMAVVVPVVLTLLMTLLFGTVFSGKARLGLADEGRSQLVPLAQALESLTVKMYESEEALREAVAIGAVDIGVALPDTFDRRIGSGRSTTLTVYTWGESALSDRVVAATALGNLIRDISGQESPVELVTVVLGDGESLSWEERLLPFLVLMTVILGGTMVPATSLVEEKQKRTLRALTITPTSLADVLLAKGLLGVILGVAMGVLTLVLNRAFGQSPGLLVLVLALGAVLSATLGVLLGAFIKDINTLFTVIKAGGLLLYAPALVYLFPEIPEWVGRVFPTYYMIQPVVEITQKGAAWPDIAPELTILVLLILLMLGVITAVVRRASQVEGTLNLA
jgi:ABC-2 type transport system permease protein